MGCHFPSVTLKPGLSDNQKLCVERQRSPSDLLSLKPGFTDAAEKGGCHLLMLSLPLYHRPQIPPGTVVRSWKVTLVSSTNWKKEIFAQYWTQEMNLSSSGVSLLVFVKFKCVELIQLFHRLNFGCFWREKKNCIRAKVLNNLCLKVVQERVAQGISMLHIYMK